MRRTSEILAAGSVRLTNSAGAVQTVERDPCLGSFNEHSTGFGAASRQEMGPTPGFTKLSRMSKGAALAAIFSAASKTERLQRMERRGWVPSSILSSLALPVVALRTKISPVKPKGPKLAVTSKSSVSGGAEGLSEYRLEAMVK